MICEGEPATQPDLMHVRHQIGVLSRVATACLIPDNHIGRATDVYGLGVILYEMLTGKRPFRGNSAIELLQQTIATEPEPVRALQPQAPASRGGSSRSAQQRWRRWSGAVRLHGV